MMIFTEELILKIIESWGISPHRIRYDRHISGSPERSLFRVVVEDRNHDLFLLENIGLNQRDRKAAIIETLKILYADGLGFINPYIKAKNKGEIINCNDSLWQLSAFISGVELKRPDYVFDGWRGERMAEILIELAGASPKLPPASSNTIFSIKFFIHQLLKKLSLFEPKIQKRVLPAVDFLENRFFQIHDQLPTGFCHGDFHPLNMIWSEWGIKAVIDWEFAGFKPEIYDMALLIGCLGMEEPDCLMNELVKRFLKKINTEKIYTPESMAFLLEFVIAIRFAWLSEWLRKNDHDMIALECDYLELLTDNQKILKQAWELG